jgi:hypothetical protein
MGLVDVLPVVDIARAHCRKGARHGIRSRFDRYLCAVGSELLVEPAGSS